MRSVWPPLAHRPPAVYATISVVQFIPPENPGATPVIPDLSTAAQIASIHYKFAQDTALF